ncbi:unnamed protein product [Chilo suppressalis]|uniref:Vacuolar protein sorting-associated protein 13 VPS13 adaptor binding domain-containing protein n=1 Tax=Chilo suppressalis TaxID=168631 RepID=A0ABN8EBG3_CHISP|nr:unnamed protein product [Chilo suppressalis]
MRSGGWANSPDVESHRRSLPEFGPAGQGAGGGAGPGSGAGGWGVYWLRSQPPPTPPRPPSPQNKSSIWPLKAVQVSADCITLCVIDDCLDSDVPLLEVSFGELRVEQDLRKEEEGLEDPLLVCTPAGPAPSVIGGAEAGAGAVAAAGATAAAGSGRLSAILSADYYNRTLSGWEPVIEPWRFETSWESTLTSELSPGRVQVEVRALETLGVNVTCALVELCQLVRHNWAADYYGQWAGGEAGQSPKGSPAGHRRRSPFVPYALRNRTGHRLWFTTLSTTAHQAVESTAGWGGPDDSWVCVRADETEPFSFGARRRARHHATASASASASAERAPALHLLALRLEGWAPPDPVCVDRVGIYFRHITHTKSGSTARIVFEVSLEGSARKLVTVRSALVLVNRLPHALELRVPRDHAHMQGSWTGGGVRVAVVGAGQSWAAPVSARPAALWARPLLHAPHAPHAPHAERGPALGPPGPAPGPTPAPAAIDWRDAPHPAHAALLHYQCRAPPDYVYRFCCSIVRERFPPDRGAPMAGHTLTLVPALRLDNLLPVEMHYRCGPAAASASATAPAPAAMGALAAGQTRPFHEVNVEEGVEISVRVEGFGWSSALLVGGGGGAGTGGSGGGSFTARLKLRDTRARRLYLTARVNISNTDAITVSVLAAYWLVNRSGLPLVAGAGVAAGGGAGAGAGAESGEAAGQGAEHEVARVVQPLLFSFTGADQAPTLSVRLGHQRAPTAQWCSPFGLGPGITVKRLTCRGAGAGAGAEPGSESGEEREYWIGVEVRAGRGRRRDTNIVTFTPRYQLHNNTPFTLQFAQKCTATTVSDPGATATHVVAVAGCFLPWHWPRPDRPRLLCVRVLSSASSSASASASAISSASTPTPLTAWSGGARVDAPRTTHFACREVAGGASGTAGSGGGYVVLRVEVVGRGASLYVLVSGADAAPPPLLIHNHSPVSIMYHQAGCSEESVVGSHGTSRWALPEPEGARAVVLRAPGGTRACVQLADPAPPAQAAPATLHYQNFVLVAFTPNAHTDANGAMADDEDVLVLEVPLGSTKVILGKKRYGDRSQLWRRGPGQQLVHEGSSPPQPTDAQLNDDNTLSPHAMVLDIEEAAPRPGVASRLVVRRADGRRASTQAWRLTRARRMQCAHRNLCVRPAPPAGLVPGNRAVLALAVADRERGARTQLVSWPTLRPGSGRLAVSLHAQGPTRVISVRDAEAPELNWIEKDEEEEEVETRRGRREWEVVVSLGGLGLSLVARAPHAELLHCVLAGLSLRAALADHCALALTVRHMQWDNQLLGTSSPVLLYCLPDRGGGAGSGGESLPALHMSLEVERTRHRRYNAVFFKHLVVVLRPLAVRLEERLILLLWLWASGGAEGQEGEGDEGADEAEGAARRSLSDLTALAATRYYFGLIKVMPSQIRLSMTTASKLEGELSALKRRLGLTLIRFEDAAVELEPFVRAHAFEPAPQLAAQLLAHFKDELKWQAAKILGSVDFLGNPLGFVADVSEGVTGLLLEGNVAALLQNVTHGLSNSAAKVTESLGDGLERVVSDEAHEETRRRIRSAAPGAHLAAGFRGLGLGILGGVTSLVKHSYEGAAAEGLPGFLAGVGKGLVGTVTKPVIGVLDLAAETASALRDTSRRSDKWVPGRVRPPRVAGGAGGLLPRYSASAADGLQLLHALAGGRELFLAYRPVRDQPHDIRALLSDACLRILTCKHAAPAPAPAPHVVMETPLSNLVSCSTVSIDGAHYVELCVRGGGASGGSGGGSAGAGAGGGGGGGGGISEGVRRPRVQCDSAELCAWVATHAALAQRLHKEYAHTLHPHPDLA